LVTESVGTFVTVTAKLHAAVCWLASRAVHVTVAAPTTKFAPDAGTHVAVSGAVPPWTSGEANDTATGLPSTDCADAATGQAIVSAGGCGGGVGVDGEPHPAQSAAVRGTNVAYRFNGERNNVNRG
jgi:hypothetical protein